MARSLKESSRPVDAGPVLCRAFPAGMNIQDKLGVSMRIGHRRGGDRLAAPAI